MRQVRAHNHPLCSSLGGGVMRFTHIYFITNQLERGVKAHGLGRHTVLRGHEGSFSLQRADTQQ